MTTTPDLGIPELSASQASAHITHNEAVVLLQALLNGIIDKDLSTPPGSPSEGDAYIVASGGTGAWASRDDNIAVYYNGAWLFIPGFDDSNTKITIGVAQEGLRVWVIDENAWYIWTGSPLAWVKGPSVVSGAVDVDSLTIGSNDVINSSRHPVLRSYTVAGAPSVTPAGQLIYVSDETGGAIPAFSDGTNWRRVSDRAIIS